MITRFSEGTPQAEALRVIDASEGSPDVPQESGEFVEPKRLSKPKGWSSDALGISWIGFTYAAAAAGGYVLLGHGLGGVTVGIIL